MNPPPDPPPAPRAGPPLRPPIPPGKRRAQIEATFNSALERPTPEREAFLATACGDDTELRKEVRELLAAHAQAAGFLKTDAPLAPEIERELARLKPEEAGERIGPYKLLQQIGEGGFGVVWMAEQEQPVRRRVALKIIKMGMDTKEVIARFEQERQALALMEHPNIAKVFDAGATPFGRPFFVMELVRGVPITSYCDEQALSTRERLELFTQVCAAIQHAHQKGVIHRDIKPSNVLVTINDGEPVAKVIDFGVAKATQSRLTDLTLFTQFQQMIGTPLYMSPEQAEMTSLDIDTRSDIYSLGVLLYELLTGSTPIDAATLRQAGIDEIRRIIREVDSPKPSTRFKTLGGAELTETARRHSIHPDRLPALLRGDLDWIVMRCLEKDRKRRYESAAALAQDLRRHLANEIITARPPTAGYLLSRLIRRHKLAFAAAAAVAVTLILGIVGTTIGLLRAERERRAAEVAQRLAEQRFSSARQFVNDMFQTVEPAFSSLIGASRAREAFARTSLTFVQSLADSGPMDEALQADLAQLYWQLADSLGQPFAPNSLGDYEAAWGFANQSLALWSDLSRKNPSDVERLRKVAELEARSGLILGNLGRHEEAAQCYQRALHGFEALAKEDPDQARSTRSLAFTHFYLGGVLQRHGRAQEALDKHFLPYGKALLDRPVARPADLDEAHQCYVAHVNVGYTLLSLGRAGDALAHLEKAFQWVKIKADMDPNDARTARDWSACLQRIGTAQMALGRTEEGAQNLEEAVRQAEKLAERDLANGPFQLTFIDALQTQAEGFATQAKAPNVPPAQQAELWHRAMQAISRGQQQLNSPALQRNKPSLTRPAQHNETLRSEAQLALEKLEAEKRQVRGAEGKD